MKLKNLVWTTTAFLLVPSAQAGFTDLVCKTTKYEFKMIENTTAGTKAVTIEVRASGAAANSPAAASFVGVDATDPHEATWPIIRGNAKNPFTFFAQSTGKPIKLVWGTMDFTKEANCSWKYKN